MTKSLKWVAFKLFAIENPARHIQSPSRLFPIVRIGSRTLENCGDALEACRQAVNELLFFLVERKSRFVSGGFEQDGEYFGCLKTCSHDD